MIIYKYVIVLFLISMLVFGGSSGISPSFRKSVDDNNVKSMSVVLDTAILNYYRNHGELPAQIDDDTLYIMGLSTYDLTDFTYQKLSDRRYSLTAALSNNLIWRSSYSNIDLPEIESEAF